MKFRSKRWVQFTLLFVVIFLVVSWFLLREPTVFSLATRDVSAVEIKRDDRDEKGKPISDANIIVDDQQAIAALLQVVHSAQETEEHKCGHRGTITLKLRNGEKPVLEYLPGHNDKFYEFRYNRKIYKVSREKFIEVMGKFDVKVPLTSFGD